MKISMTSGQRIGAECQMWSPSKTACLRCSYAVTLPARRPLAAPAAYSSPLVLSFAGEFCRWQSVCRWSASKSRFS
eukprot:3903815-Amphidinium_carterae.1